MFVAAPVIPTVVFAAAFGVAIEFASKILLVYVAPPPKSKSVLLRINEFVIVPPFEEVIRLSSQILLSKIALVIVNGGVVPGNASDI